MYRCLSGMVGTRRNTQGSTSDSSALIDKYPNLSSDGKLLVTIMQEEFTKLRNEMQTDFQQMMHLKNEEIKQLKDQIHILDGNLAKMKENIDEGDAYERRDTILLSGNSIPVFSQGENTANIAIQIFKNELRMEVSERDISVAHRVGKKPANQQPDKRNIILKLCRRDLKRPLIIASRKLPTEQRQNIHINESLTPTRSTILYALRQVKREHPGLVKGCSSFEGRIYAFTAPPHGAPATNKDRRHLINNHESLVRFCREYVNKPLTAFLENWSH